MRIDSHRIKFYEFLNNDILLGHLVEWIYTNKELENVIPDDQYLDLISYNYSDPAVDVYLKSFVRRNFDWDEYETWRTIELLDRIMIGEFELFSAAIQLSQLYSEQEEDMEEPLVSIGLAVGYASDLDRLPHESEYKNWNQEVIEAKLEALERLKTQMLEDIEKELIKLRG